VGGGALVQYWFYPANRSSVSIIPPVFRSSRHPDARLTGWINGLSMRTFRKLCSFAYQGAFYTKVLRLLSVLKVDKCHWGRFSRALQSFPVIIILSTLHIHINHNTAGITWTSGRNLETFKHIGKHWTGKYFHAAFSALKGELFYGSIEGHENLLGHLSPAFLSS